MGTRHSILALALLFVLSAISGCRREVKTSVSTTGDIELSAHHTPVIYVYEGQVLRWHPTTGAIVLTLSLIHI